MYDLAGDHLSDVRGGLEALLPRFDPVLTGTHGDHPAERRGAQLRAVDNDRRSGLGHGDGELAEARQGLVDLLLDGRLLLRGKHPGLCNDVSAQRIPSASRPTSNWHMPMLSRTSGADPARTTSNAASVAEASASNVHTPIEEPVRLAVRRGGARRGETDGDEKDAMIAPKAAPPHASCRPAQLRPPLVAARRPYVTPAAEPTVMTALFIVPHLSQSCRSRSPRPADHPARAAGCFADRTAASGLPFTVGGRGHPILHPDRRAQVDRRRRWSSS